MDARKFLSESRTAPLVIGIILMVVTTVILAAIIGTFVFGLGDQVGDTAPRANFSFNYDGVQEITITHESGDSITSGELSVVIPSSLTADTVPKEINSDDSMNVGDTIAVELAADGELEDGDQVRLIWTSESGSNLTALQTYTH